MKPTLVAGSRESQLALVQTAMVTGALASRFPGIDIPVKTFKTQGDVILESALSRIGEKGLFVKELELALLAGEIDFAVHSMKDMPSQQPEGLCLVPFGPRETPEDAFISKHRRMFDELPAGAVIGTSSLRRQALLKRMRPDLHVQVVRGNVQTRLRKMEEGPYDGLVLAAAGLRRLRLDGLIMHTFSPEVMLPACCQGTLAVEIRDESLLPYFEPFIDPVVACCTQAERAFLQTLQGGCQIPMAAYARPVEENRFSISGLVSDAQGTQVIWAEMPFTPDTAHRVGQQLARQLLDQGGAAILQALLHNSRRG